MKKFTSILLMLFFALSGLFAANMKGGEVFYLTPHTTWNSDNARYAIYFFNNSTNKNTWVSMSKVEGESNLWTGTAPAGDWANLIFCRMNPSASSNGWGEGVYWGGQTQDLTWDGTNNWFTVDSSKDAWSKPAGTWSTYTLPTPDPEPEDPDQPVDPEDPDQPVDPEDPDQPVDPEDPDQPVDPEDPDQPVDPEDPDTPVVPDPEEPEEPAGITFTVQVPEGTIECYVTGADLWNTGEFLQMEKVEGEDNLFTITTTALKGTAWKYCSGPSWDYVEKDAQGNEISDRTAAGNPDVVASWLALYTPEVDPEDPDQPVDPEDPDQPVDPEDPDQPVDPEDPDTPVVPDPEEPEEPAGITFTVQVPEGTIECYVTGADLWNTGEFLQMEKVEGEDNLFTITTTALKGTAWKYCSGPSWDYVEKDAQGNEITDRTEAGNPDVVASWLALYTPEVDPEDPDQPVDPEDPDQPVDPEDPDQPVDPEDPDQPVDPEEPTGITFTVQVPEGTIECYITGADLWNTGEFLQMEKVEGEDNLFTITTTALKGTAWKYCSGPSWDYVEKDAQGNEITDRTEAGNPDVVASWLALYTPEVDPEDPDQPVDPEDPDQPVDPEDPDQPVDPEDPDQPVDPEDPDQPVDPEEPAAITYTVQVPEGTIECYITGADLWNTGEFLQMEKVEGEDNLFTITTTALKGTEWKYASGPSWDYVEKDAQGGEVANRTEAGNPDVVASWLAVYDPEGETTAVDEAETLNIYANEGTIYADAEIAIYNLAGVDVTAQNGALYGIYIVKAANGASLINVW